MKIVSAPAVFLGGLLAASCADAQSQAAYSFDAAIHNRSMSQSVVLITAIDDRTGEQHVGCTRAAFVLGAIRFEYGLEGVAAEQFAIANTSRIFHFSKPEALHNLVLGFSDDAGSERMKGDLQAACELVKQGKPVFFADRNNAMRVGQP
jgi:hypothetical protein